MLTKKMKKFTACLLAGVMSIAIAGTNMAFAEDQAQSGQTTDSSESKVQIQAKDRASVHDPSIVKDGENYYVFGSHIEAAKSTDLQNWTKFTNSYTTPDNQLFGDLSENLSGSFAWAGENDSDSKGGYAVWAPCVFYNKDYANEDGTTGAYMMYYCTSSTYKRSDIGFATSQNIEGPYTYGNTIIYSGFTKGDSYDDNSTINTNYQNTNIKKLIDNGTLSDANDSWFTSAGAYNTSYAPNAIDPELFYDKDGTLWMNYGSWSGGIYMLKIDPKTGTPLYPGNDANTDTINPTDRYFGTRIGGGYTKSGEGSEIVYDKDNGYYYLYMSYGSLQAKGGYNIRLFRSKNPEGPYVDEKGNNAALSGSVDNAGYGIKLIGNYKFNCLDVGYRAAGHNSSFIDSDGQMYLVYHTRFDDGTENHQVRVHQMFINEDGWPVVAAYENSGDKISTSGYSKDEIVGNYEFINHGSENSSAMLDTLAIKLNDDYTITGDATGTWSMQDGSYYMNAVIEGVTYKGVFYKQQDESGYESKVMTFTAVGSNNQCIWGSKLELQDSEAVEYAANALTSKISSSTKTNITLPTTGAYDTTISWASSNENVLDNNGTVNRASSDQSVTLTATISKGDSKYTKTFTVLVKGKLSSISETPIYKYDFETVNDTNSIANSGSKDGAATLEGSASIASDQDRGKVLSIKNAKGAIKANYLALPSDTFSGITSEGYTVGMWVNVDTTDSNYFEHSALFEANDGGTYPLTRISANLYGRINANGSYADATEISKSLTGNTWEYVTYTVNSEGIVVYVNGEQVGTAEKDLSACFSDDFLAKMTNVTVGSGSIWGDQDIASAKFDNVSIYNTALTDEEVEALYNTEEQSSSGEISDDEISVDYQVNEKWGNQVKSTVKITNTSGKTISNWAVKGSFAGDITQIWNAAIDSQSENTYVIKNTGYPKDITTGASVEFGFIASYDGDTAPEFTDCSIVSSSKTVDDNDYTVDFSKTGEWDNGFNGSFSINNTSSEAIEDWTLEFDYKDTINSIWNADIASHEGDHYVIKCKSYNSDIKAGSNITFGFQGAPSDGTKSQEVPTNYVLTKVTN